MICIPNDQISSGHTDSTCWAQFYGKTEKDVKKKVIEYLHSYPPEGYNTRITKSGKHADGYFYAFMKRWHSCD